MRFRDFEDEELHELRFGVMSSRAWAKLADRPDTVAVCDRLESEIIHEQTQREHREARLRNPA